MENKTIRKRSTTVIASIGIVLIAATSGVAEAQGRGGGMGRHRGGDDSQPAHQAEDQGGEWSSRFEDMASTKRVLEDVKVEKSAKDSINRIEKTYKDRFHTYGNAAKRTFEEAKGQSQPPNFAQLDTLVQYARTLQDQEYAEVRPLLAADQRPTFDANIAQRRADDDKELAERRQRLHVPTR
jgi:hypothetical protein